MLTDRDYDLVLVGATGFVGRLSAAHLARSAPAGLRVALAGRSAEKLERVRAELPEPAQQWPLVTLDVTDQSEADDLARRSAVIATTVGPYAAYGRQLVAACATGGTHYADLTGEVLFVQDTIARHHDTAAGSGAKIVHSCGFDSVPSDLGVMLAAQAARDDDAGRLVDVRLHVCKARGGFSGGTVDSIRQQMIAMREDPSTRRIVGDPDALAAGRTAYGKGPAALGKDPATGRWHGPFVMSAYNTRIVRRSWSLTEGAVPLVYSEVVDAGAGWKGAAIASGIGLGTAGFAAALATKPTRSLLDRALPAPGEGPSPARRSAGTFEIEIRATTTEGSEYAVSMGAPYDPGYDGTAVMLGESALALAAGQGSDRAGVLTPSTALGEGLVQRLRAHGFTLRATRR